MPSSRRVWPRRWDAFPGDWRAIAKYVVIMVLVALLPGFMSSTGTVAVMLPVVMGLAWAREIPPSKLLIPLSVASLLGGMLTLIGTVGKTLKEIRFRDRYGLTVCGVQKLGRAVAGDVRDTPLRFGDMLLIQGSWERIPKPGSTPSRSSSVASRAMGLTFPRRIVAPIS